MIEPPTSRAGVGPRLPSIYAELIAFVRSPHLPAVTAPWGGRAALDVAWLLLLNLGISLALSVLLGMLSRQSGIKPPDFTMLTERGWLFTLVAGAGLIPIGEELVFRSWIDGRRLTVMMMAVAVATAGLLALLTAAGAAPATRMGWLGVGIVLIAWLAWRGRRDERHVAQLVRGFAWIYWLQALLFALAHLTNYGSVSWPLLLFVVPQLVAGLIFGFARVRFGMWANIVLHAASNGLILAGMLAT
jgi:Type II CAAX prenyl endopeptidase Rce1-like